MTNGKEFDKFYDEMVTNMAKTKGARAALTMIGRNGFRDLLDATNRANLAGKGWRQRLCEVYV